MERVKNLIFNIFLSFVSLILVFILAEALSRIYLMHFANENVFTTYASYEQLKERYQPLYLPHRYLGYSPTPFYEKEGDKHDSYGYRGEEAATPKPEGEYRIIFIGGSTVYTTGVTDYREAYPYLLEKILHERGYSNVRVINAGGCGWTSWESLIDFEFRALDLRPDMIIIYHGINDLHSRLVWPPEAYKGDNSGRMGAGVIFSTGILERSTLIRALLIRAGIVTPHVSLERNFQRSADTYYGDDFYEQKANHTYPDGIFRQVSAKQMFVANKPVFFRRNTENIVAIAKARGITPVIASFAYSTRFSDPQVSEEYAGAIDEMNSVSKEIAAETGAVYFDFAGAFPTDESNYTDGQHFNAKGSALAAELYADYLIKNGLLPPLR